MSNAPPPIEMQSLAPPDSGGVGSQPVSNLGDVASAPLLPAGNTKKMAAGPLHTRRILIAAIVIAVIILIVVVVRDLGTPHGGGGGGSGGYTTGTYKVDADMLLWAVANWESSRWSWPS